MCFNGTMGKTQLSMGPGAWDARPKGSSASSPASCPQASSPQFLPEKGTPTGFT